MSTVSFADFLRALLLKALLSRLGSSRPATTAPLSPPAPEPPRPGGDETPARPGRAIPALALLAVGAILMLVFEAPVTRVIGVLALFAFVVAGVFAIADPRWLGSAPDLGHGDESSRGPTG